MTNTKTFFAVFAVFATLVTIPLALDNTADAALPPMATCIDPTCAITTLHTVGESIGDYTPVGILDGIGAYELNDDTVRAFANHELLHFRGNTYQVGDGMGGQIDLTGARVSYFDIDKDTREIVDSGLAYNKIYDHDGNVASDTTVFANGFGGFSRLCSSGLSEAEQFGKNKGLEDTIYFTGEEDGGFFNNQGGAIWALDPATHSI